MADKDNNNNHNTTGGISTRTRSKAAQADQQHDDSKNKRDDNREHIEPPSFDTRVASMFANESSEHSNNRELSMDHVTVKSNPDVRGASWNDVHLLDHSTTTSDPNVYSGLNENTPAVLLGEVMKGEDVTEDGVVNIDSNINLHSIPTEADFDEAIDIQHECNILRDEINHDLSDASTIESQMGTDSNGVIQVLGFSTTNTENAEINEEDRIACMQSIGITDPMFENERDECMTDHVEHMGDHLASTSIGDQPNIGGDDTQGASNHERDTVKLVGDEPKTDHSFIDKDTSQGHGLNYQTLNAIGAMFHSATDSIREDITKEFHRANDSTREDITKLSNTVDKYNNKFETKFGELDNKLEQIENRGIKLSDRIEEVNAKVDRLKSQLDERVEDITDKALSKYTSEYEKLVRTFSDLKGQCHSKLKELQTSLASHEVESMKNSITKCLTRMNEYDVFVEEKNASIAKMQQDILKSLQTAQQVASLENRIDGILGPKGLTNSFEEQVNKHIEYARDEYLRQYEDSNNESKLYVTSMAQECDLAYNKIQREFESRHASLSAADTILDRIKPWLEKMDMEDIQGVSTRVKALEQDLKAIIGFIDYSPSQDGTTSKKRKKSKAVTMTMVHAAIKQQLRDTNMSTQTPMDTKLIESSVMASLQQQGIMSAKSTINMVNSAIKQFREDEIVSQIDPEFIESEVKRSLQEHGVISDKGNVYTKEQTEFLSMLESQREKFESIVKLLDSKYTNASSVHDDIMKLYEGVKKEITKYRSTPQTPASGFETHHIQPDQNEIENMVTKILTSRFQSQLNSQHDMLMASSQQALQMINDQMEACLSNIPTTTDSTDQPPTSEDTSNYIYGHVLRSDNSKSLSFTVEDRQRLCKSGWNIRRIFKSMTEAEDWSVSTQENHNSSINSVHDCNDPSGGAQPNMSNTLSEGAQPKLSHTPSGDLSAGAQSNMSHTPSGGAQSNMPNSPGQANQHNGTQHDKSRNDSNKMKQSNPDGGNPDNDEQDDVIAGWINIATGKRQLVCCKEDQQYVKGIQWRFQQRFNNRLAANAWLAAEELVPQIDKIQGWYNEYLDERYIVSCRDDLNQVFGKYWTRVCYFTTLREAIGWREEIAISQGIPLNHIH
eukprot:scaffold26960_cov22-Cyclotella_meneghiniana.AAC.1